MGLQVISDVPPLVSVIVLLSFMASWAGLALPSMEAAYSHFFVSVMGKERRTKAHWIESGAECVWPVRH